MNKITLQEEIKHIIIKTLELENISPSDISSENSLFDDKSLGLDSIDGLEVWIALEKHYRIKIDHTQNDEKDLVSISDIADYIMCSMHSQKVS